LSALPADRLSPAPVLVCGLGALGQACLERLLALDLPLHGVDLRQPNWRDPELVSRLAGTLTHGDMRLAHVVRLLGAERASAVLLLSADSTINFEAALQVRLLNPAAEIVLRSTSRLDDLGALLELRLPGVAVVDPILLCADAITTALRPASMGARGGGWPDHSGHGGARRGPSSPKAGLASRVIHRITAGVADGPATAPQPGPVGPRPNPPPSRPGLAAEQDSEAARLAACAGG